MATFVTNGSMSDQLVLFSEKRWPAGLRYEPAFVSPDEERALVTCLAELPLAPFQFGAFEGKRRVASFGWRYDFSCCRAVPLLDRPGGDKGRGIRRPARRRNPAHSLHGV